MDRTGPASGLPLTVEPSPPFGQLWLDASGTLDAAPVGMTLSDGGRWQRDSLRPRWRLSGGIGIARFAAALDLGEATLGVAGQADLLRRDSWKLGVTAAAHAVGAHWDLSLVPALATRSRLSARVTLVPFAAARVRWARTPYDVQGWDDARSTAYASVVTRDLALAPMVGVAAVTRLAELRITAGWEILLEDRVEWEQRPSGFSCAGGPFALATLRLRLGAPP